VTQPADDDDVTREIRRGLHCPTCLRDTRVEMDLVLGSGLAAEMVVSSDLRLTLQGCESCHTGICAPADPPAAPPAPPSLPGQRRT
jgi:hypothetical protein